MSFQLRDEITEIFPEMAEKGLMQPRGPLSEAASRGCSQETSVLSLGCGRLVGSAQICGASPPKSQINNPREEVSPVVRNSVLLHFLEKLDGKRPDCGARADAC